MTEPRVAPPIRVIVAKPGLDGHDRGAKVVAKALKDAGMEVIYTGRHQTVDAIVTATVQEDAEAVGLSILSGAHMDYCTRLRRRLDEEGADDVVLLVGGTIPAGDVRALEAMGYRVFGTGSRLGDIVAYVQSEVTRRRG
ncbi:MAG TPA: cobalamin B12-binding domain-containing protein [Candidatus Dormibacteraeota bacterium]|nr:cobalamin B12-binding domain-containing protein [Candidatus Dormibacteraeota bacterium]